VKSSRYGKMEIGSGNATWIPIVAIPSRRNT
jgi:hypothetical protein